MNFKITFSKDSWKIITLKHIQHAIKENLSFIRTLKIKIYIHMTAVSMNFYFDMLGDIVKKYNNIVHRTIKMKPIDVTFDS